MGLGAWPHLFLKTIQDAYKEDMTQNEKWNQRYREVVDFIEINHRNPSRHRIEEHDMLNWLKANRKKMNAGTLKQNRIEQFNKLLALVELNKHVNQYQ